jgi:hypothetical protein
VYDALLAGPVFWGGGGWAGASRLRRKATRILLSLDKKSSCLHPAHPAASRKLSRKDLILLKK